MISTLTCYLGNWYVKPVGSSIDNKYKGWETLVIPEGTMHVVIQRHPVYVLA